MFSQVENPSQHIWKLLGLFFQIFYSLLKTKNSNWFSRVLVSFTLLSHCSSWHSSFRIVWTSVMIMQLLPTGLLQHFTNKTQCILYLCYTVYSLYKVLIVVCLERFLWKLLACSLLSPLDAKTFHHDSILSFEIISALFCSLIKKSNFFLLGYETECSWVFSLFFLLAHIFMSCFVSGSLWDSLSQAGITAGGEVELVRLRLRQPMAHPQAHWTLCAVWILPVSCSSHCVIGRIMFRDSLFFAPHMFRLSSSVHFSILKMEPGQQAVRLPPSVLQFCWWAGRYYCSSGTDSSEVIIHQLF